MDITLLGPGTVFHFQYRYRMEIGFSVENVSQFQFQPGTVGTIFPMHVQADHFKTYDRTTIPFKNCSKTVSKTVPEVFFRILYDSP